MQFDLEKKTPFSVGSQDVIDLVQDAKKFLIASGGSEEDSISYDESTGLWHATSKDGIALLPKPKYTAKVEKTEKGAKWTVDAGMGITSHHTWTVESVSEQECNATEYVTVEAPAIAFHAVKWQWPGTQAKSHKCLQEYLS